MVARVTLIGNLGKPPEIKTTQAGKKFARFSVAVNKYANKEKTTMWVDCVVWNEKTSEFLEGFATKGSKLYIDGTLEKRTYQKDGVEKLAVEVHVPAFGGDVQLLSRPENGAGGSAPAPMPAMADADDVPF